MNPEPYSGLQRREMSAEVLGYEINGCYERGVRLVEIVFLLREGHGVRETARLSECSSVTAAKIRRQMVAQRGEIRCRCGKPSTHRGWCRFRFATSRRRRIFMKKWQRGRGYSRNDRR
jgi:hypothetical protein